MKVDEDKIIEKFIDTAMKNTSIETPSIDFTSKLMQQILTAKSSKTIVYKPLISKSVWFIILGSIISIFFFVISKNDTQTVSWFDFLLFKKTNLTILPFNFSKISMYAILLAVFLLLVQISLLKNHFDKQFEK